MLAMGNINFEFDSLKEAFKKNTIQINSEYLALYLYMHDDIASYNMIKNNSREIQSKLKIDLFTYFDKKTFEMMGRFYGKPRVLQSMSLFSNSTENDVVKWEDTDSELPFEKMKKIGDEYSVKKYPAIVIINPKDACSNFKDSYHVIEIEKDKFENNIFAKTKVEQDSIVADIIYRYFFEPFMSIVAGLYSENFFFKDLKKKFDFSKHYALINKELELEHKFDNDDINNVRIFIQQGNRGCIDRRGNRLQMDVFTFAALNITADTYGRRYTRAIGFTRDELICIALCLGFSYMELNRLIELHNKAFKKTYRFINHEDSRDALFLKLISTGKKYEYQRINSELRRNKEDEISLLNL